MKEPYWLSKDSLAALPTIYLPENQVSKDQTPSWPGRDCHLLTTAPTCGSPRVRGWDEAPPSTHSSRPGRLGSQLWQGRAARGCLSACQQHPHAAEAPPGLAGAPKQGGPGRQALPGSMGAVAPAPEAPTE